MARGTRGPTRSHGDHGRAPTRRHPTSGPRVGARRHSVSSGRGLRPPGSLEHRGPVRGGRGDQRKTERPPVPSEQPGHRMRHGSAAGRLCRTDPPQAGRGRATPPRRRRRRLRLSRWPSRLRHRPHAQHRRASPPPRRTTTPRRSRCPRAGQGVLGTTGADRRAHAPFRPRRRLGRRAAADPRAGPPRRLRPPPGRRRPGPDHLRPLGAPADPVRRRLDPRHSHGVLLGWSAPVRLAIAARRVDAALGLLRSRMARDGPLGKPTDGPLPVRADRMHRRGLGARSQFAHPRARVRRCSRRGSRRTCCWGRSP